MREYKTYKNYQIALIVFVSVLFNFFGSLFARKYNLPLWLDSFGTFLTAYTLGPVCAIIVGISGDIFQSLIDPIAFVYSLTAFFIALSAGILCARGWMDNLLKTMSLGVVITGVSTGISVALNMIFRGGQVGNMWGSGMVELLGLWGIPKIICIILGQFYVDFLDKVLTLCALYFFIRFYRNTKQYLPGFLKIKSILAFVFAFSVLSGFYSKADAQTLSELKNFNSYVRTVYSNTTGLPGGEANDIASTNDGILWIGTYAGLYRHNGYEFRLMRDFTSIKAVKCLYVDDEGRLFVGTNDNGLSIVINEEVSNVIEEKDGLPSDSVRCITRSSNGLYYVGTTEEMAVVSIRDGLGIQAVIGEVRNALRVTADENGNVAAVNSKGELFFIKDFEIVYRSDITKDKFTCASFLPDGRLYASNQKNEVVVYDVENHVGITQDEEDNSNRIYEEFIVQETGRIECPCLRSIKSIRFADDVIFLTADNGVGFIQDDVCHKIETGSFNNSIDNMEVDYQGNLWFASSRMGLLKMCETSFAEIYVSAGLKESVVNSTAIYENNLYFGTDDGLFMVDSKTGRKSVNELTKLLYKIRVRCLMVDKSGALWICTKTRGIIRAKDGKISSFEQDSPMRVAIELSDGTVVAGGNNGVVFIEGDRIVSRLDGSDGLENPLILTLQENVSGKILAGTDGGGLAVLDKTDGEWKLQTLIKRSDGLSSNVILRTVNDFDGKAYTDGVFVITSNGICYLKLEKDGQTYSIRILSNFPYSNNYDLIITKRKELFVLGSAGIFIVNRDELLSGNKVDYKLFDLKKGLRGSLTANSWDYLDKDGNLYISCDCGASCLNINTYDKKDKSYRIQLKSILIDGKRHVVQKDIPFMIPSDTTMIEISPEIINYSIENPFVSFYLEGADDTPSVMRQSEISSVIYSNLDAGNYDFHISVLDSRGRNVVEESVYSFTKAFHIYDNWWFVLYAVGVAMLIIAWISWFFSSSFQARRIERQQAELENVKNQVRIGNETIFAIAAAVEARDKSTGRHSFRVAEYSVMIAKELGFDKKQLQDLYKTGLLHDIGKIGVPDSILNKPDKLTPKEYEIMKKHTIIGGEILQGFSLIENVADGANYHHERYDGTGYPKGLKGEEIPLNARIIGLADAFDAMTANRIYRKALKMNQVIAEIKRCSGTQFDSDLAQIMLEIIENGKLDVSSIYEESKEESKV